MQDNVVCIAIGINTGHIFTYVYIPLLLDLSFVYLWAFCVVYVLIGLRSSFVSQ